MADLKPAAFGSDLLDAQSSLELRRSYELMDQRQERRARAGFTSASETETNLAERESLGGQVLSRVGQNQVNLQVSRLAGTARNQSALRSARKPAVVVAAAAALYFGQPFELQASESTSFHLVSEMRRRRAELVLQCPVARGEIDFDGARDPASDLGGRENARLSLSRGLPVWDLGSRVEYGATSSTVTATLSKQLTREVAVSVDSQEYVRVSYQLSF